MARPRLQVTRSEKLSSYVTPDEKMEFYDACEKVKIQPSETLRQLAAALARHVSEHGEVTQPIRLAPPPSKKH